MRQNSVLRPKLEPPRALLRFLNLAMEPGLKRARGQPPSTQPNSWARMVQKLMALVIPMNYYLENMMQASNNNRCLAKKMVNSLNMEDLIFTRELVNAQIHKMQLEYDEEDSGSFSLVPSTSGKRPESPPPSRGYRQRSSASSAAPTEVSVTTQKRGEAKVGDVHGLEVIYGDNPSCHCGLMGRLHLAQTEGPNFDRTFYRCPRPIGNQCRFFMWTTQQPFHDVTSWKYQDQGQGRTPPAEALQLMVQEKCTHPKKTRQGTNGLEERKTCKICRKILKQEPKHGVGSKAKNNQSGTSSTASAEEMLEFQKFLTWRRGGEK